MAKRCIVAGLGMVALCGQGAQAVDLSWAPQLRVGTRATDNIQWTTTGKEAALGFDTGGGLALKAVAQAWNSAVNPSFNFRRFLIGEDIDADEYGVRSQHQYKVTERVQTSLQADYVRDSTLSSELTDAGRRNDVANRDTLTIAPGVNYLVTDSTVVNASYMYSDVGFDASLDQGFVDYTFQQWSAGTTHFVSGRLQVSANFFVTDFEVASTSSETWTYGGMVGATYSWSDSLSTTGSVGYQTASTDFVEQILTVVPGTNPPQIVVVEQPANSKSSGPIANFGIRKRFANMRAEFNYARRVSPSARGAQTLEDDIMLNIDYDVSERWGLGFRGGYNLRSAQAEELGGAIRDLNRNQGSLGGSVTYKASEEISFRGEYRFTRQTLAETDERVYVHAMFVSMIFNGAPHFHNVF
ncbi:MAG: hypothetical protein K2Y51_01215 [Gammaproteobacteria bacterium]|nr:hypothetical protein [Gammaproteobacteria bacterium]